MARLSLPHQLAATNHKLCVYCVCRRDESYIGQIDLEDIRVICNRAVASPGVWSTNTDSGVVVNARALELLSQKQHGDCTILNNQRATPVKHGVDGKAAADAVDNSSDAGASDILVENGRIVLQYRNVHAGVRATENATAKVHDPDPLDKTGPGHVVSTSGKSLVEQDYDMNDIVWKNMAASSSSTKY